MSSYVHKKISFPVEVRKEIRKDVIWKWSEGQYLMCPVYIKSAEELWDEEYFWVEEE